MVAQSPEPGAHILNARAFRIELEFRNVGFCGEGKTGVPGEKPLGAEKRTNNKLNPHMTSSPGIEPGPHWWKASALTTAPSLLPLRSTDTTSPNEADEEPFAESVDGEVTRIPSPWTLAYRKGSGRGQ